MLLLGLLATLVFLARDYELNRQQTRLNETAAGMVEDIRGGLQRNLQDLQALLVPGLQGAHDERLTRLFTRHREIMHVERRDAELGLIFSRVSPYRPRLLESRSRDQVQEDWRQACTNARRQGGAAYSQSYYWPLAEFGLELMELCLPLGRAGREEGYLLVTYSLPGLLSELTSAEARRQHSVALNEISGARLSIIGVSHARGGMLRAAQPLDLPGAVYLLQVERSREPEGWLPHVLSATLALLGLLLLGLLVLLGLDMSKRQRVERELAETLAFRQAMEESMVTGMRARDMQGHICYVNPAFCELVGLPSEHLIGTGVPAPYWPPERAEDYERRQRERLTGHDFPREGFESEFLHADGRRIPVRIIEAPLIDRRGVQTGWMSTIIDLTEQRRMEELTRTSQERLQVTSRLAMLGEMASLVSHELNQPLAAIASYTNGCLNLLQEPDEITPELLAELREAMRRAVQQAERAGKVTRGVADLVRRRDGERCAVSARELFDAVAPLLQLRARQDGIELKWELPEDELGVWCDRTMVEQVLLNLARNGVQAMPPGEPLPSSGLRALELSVRRLSDEAGRGMAEFRVSDHGHGLSDEVERHLFTPFFTTKASGMGLGLSLCRTVVEQHGGTLRFERLQPQGTAFCFTLPLAPLPA